jgi:hypothetical protein
MTLIQCNMEKFNDFGKFEQCGEPAIWKHPRWPTGVYCEDHKRTLEQFFPNDWQKIEELENLKDVQRTTKT